MNSWLEALDLWARLGVQSLLNSFWQGVLIVGLIWLLLRISGRVSATTRHALWFISLLTVGSLPLLGLFFPVTTARYQLGAKPSALATQAASLKVLATVARANFQPTDVPIRRTPVSLSSSSTPAWALPAASRERLVAEVRTTSAGAPNPSPNSLLVTATVTSAQPKATSETFSNNAPPIGWKSRWAQWLNDSGPLWLALLWALVAGALSCRIGLSYWHLFKLRRALVPAEEVFCQRATALAEHFGIRRTVRLMTAASVKMPLTIGCWHPLIVLPPGLLETLSRAEADSILAHELAHIKRWDYASNFLQRLLQAVLFFHPAVWFINKQLVIERELACDDWAIKLTGEPRRYASCLTKLVAVLSESKPLAAATGILFGKHIISRRVEMILNRDRNATTSVSKPALVYAIGLAFLFVFACSTLSPVIAVPLAQKPAKKAPEAKAPAAPKTPSSPTVAPARSELLDLPALLDLTELPALPAQIEIDGDMVDVPALVDLRVNVQDALQHLEAVPLPALSADVWQQVQEVAAIAPAAPAAPAAPIAPLAWGGVAPAFPAAPAYISGIGQSSSGDKAKTPAIPESELLSLLSDIVKKDADENVRREALQGIYRMRSDAAINTLIQLYDATSDVKTKTEILNYLMRRNGDNAKATAKLVQIAKTEKNEVLLSAALNQLAYVKGDEGADQLVSIYDGIQDAKLKQRVIRSLAYNKSKKAIDKLMSIAKNDSDPVVRQAAIRSLYAIDNQLYLNFAEGKRVGVTGAQPNFDSLREMKNFNFEFDAKKYEVEREAFEKMQHDAREMQERAQEKMREMQERMRDDWRETKPRATQPRTEEERRAYERELQRQRNNQEQEQKSQGQKSSGQAPAKVKPATRVAATF